MRFPRKFLLVPALAALMLVMAPVAMTATASADTGMGSPGVGRVTTCTSFTEVVNGVVVSHFANCCSGFFQEEWVGGRWLGWNGSTWFARDGDMWVGWDGTNWLEGDGTNWWAWNGTNWWVWNAFMSSGFFNDCSGLPWHFAGDPE